MSWFGWLRRKQSASTTAVLGDFPDQGGRKRTLGVPYLMPTDLEEMNRLDFQHYMLRYALRGNYAAPIGAHPSSILDVGTGTGRWAREIANLFPQANVIGVDVNQPPTDSMAEEGREDLRPPNYTFVPGNLFEGLPFADGSFDFTHMRLLIMAIPHDQWPKVVQELIRVTRPGGWVESVETTILQHAGPAMSQIIQWSTTVLGWRGVNMLDGEKIGSLLHSAGLAHVTTQPVMLPCGDYGGRVGKMLAADYISGAKGLGGVVVSRGLATADEFERVLAAASAEFASPQARCVVPFYVAYGQRMS
ncbi:MAG TPA: methyltransferase domain-containing protein [Ktedonobacterales bacterium]|nr:methyltransferase domain-containing protein [Ktedonobacterales bacterium]